MLFSLLISIFPVRVFNSYYLQGPTDEITSLLSEILQEELGNGKTELNHSTLYTTLLASCSIHLPKVFQKAYALDSKILVMVTFFQKLLTNLAKIVFVRTNNFAFFNVTFREIMTYNSFAI